MKPATALALSLWLTLASAAAWAELQQEMDAMFSTLTNGSSPTAHLGQRRGVLSGGSLVVRNRIMQTQPIAMVPPSFSAGCGGIDLYGGSFSFINMNQFVTLMRSIAANAGGYAFQLAINAMCPDCGNVMTDLQKKIQQFNQLFSNSCQLAQGIVNDGVSAFDTQNKSRMSNIAFSKGVSDVFGSWTAGGGQGDPVQQAKSGAPKAFQTEIQGNLVWRALNRVHAGRWFAFGGPGFLEAIMSVTGSLILQAPVSAEDDQGENTPLVNLPPMLRLRDLINGSGSGTDPAHGVKVYRCDTPHVDGCLTPRIENLELQGLKPQVEALLLGTDSGAGLIQKFATNSGSLSEAEQAFMDVTPAALGALLRNLAREDLGLARLLAEEGAPVIALELAQLLIQDMLDAVRQATAVNDHAYAQKLSENLDHVREELRAEYSELAGRYGNSQSLLAFYHDLMGTLKPGHYGSYGQPPGSAPAFPRP